jgi:hypothetical protein
VASIVVKTRVRSRALAASVEELDDLAAALGERTSSDAEPHWTLKLRRLAAIDVTGRLLDAERLDLSSLRAFTLTVRSSANGRRVVLEAERVLAGRRTRLRSLRVDCAN